MIPPILDCFAKKWPDLMGQGGTGESHHRPSKAGRYESFQPHNWLLNPGRKGTRPVCRKKMVVVMFRCISKASISCDDGLHLQAVLPLPLLEGGLLR